jgi:hypothetical protein
MGASTCTIAAIQLWNHWWRDMGTTPHHGVTIVVALYLAVIHELIAKEAAHQMVFALSSFSVPNMIKFGAYIMSLANISRRRSI